jgi:DNA-binding LacI/PurR family transcriptional regulator
MRNPTWKEIADRLSTDIKQGRWLVGDRIPSEVELATELGVSRQTVHRAMSELHRNGLVSRQRRNGTVVQGSGGRRTGLIALIMDQSTDFPQADLVRGIQSVLGEQYRVSLYDVGDDAERERQALLRAVDEVDGILVYASSQRGTSEILNQTHARVPVVCVDRVPDGAHCDGVVSDNYAATRRALDPVVKGTTGPIAFFSGDNEHVSTVRDRYRAYRDSLGARFDERYERWYPKSLEQNPERLVRMAMDSLVALEREGAPGAIFCLQDIYAVAVMDAYERLNLSSPLPMLVTYNDWPPIMLRRASEMTRIVQPTFEIGRAAAERVLARIDGDRSKPQVQLLTSDVWPSAVNSAFLMGANEASEKSTEGGRSTV